MRIFKMLKKCCDQIANLTANFFPLEALAIE